jgi:hypothetical protein
MNPNSSRLARWGARAIAALALALPAATWAAHPFDVALVDDQGESVATSGRPYSPVRSCGGNCHDFPTITQGYHFQQGRTNVLGAIQVSDTFAGNLFAGTPGFGTGSWWKLSDGMYGKW